MRVLLFLFLLAVCVNAPVWAFFSPWVSSDHVRARLLVDTQDAQAFPALTGALHIDLAEGWHTYWREPGDAGLPPVFDWARSHNVESVTLHWPAPKQKEENGFNTQAYEHEVVFPLDIILEDGAQDGVLNLNTRIMVCKDICIPQALTISLALKAEGEQDSGFAQFIDKAQAKIPAGGDSTVFDLSAPAHSAE